MPDNNIIRKLLAGFLFLLFALCVTPKKALHDLVADHQDSPFTSTGAAQQHVSNAGFRCNCDDLVVASPFVSDFVPIDIIVAAGHTSRGADPAGGSMFLHHFYYELRGPPSTS